MRQEPTAGELYRHFKDKLYQVVCVAYHSETMEKMVVYQALYGDYSSYVRPLEMFMSEVDHVKYPDVKQQYRFERVLPDGSDMPHSRVHCAKKQDFAKEQLAAGVVPDPKQPDCKREPDVPDGGKADDRLELFLDAPGYQDKIDVLIKLRNDMDDKLIDAMAASMDTEVTGETTDARYRSLLNFIRTHAKYERTRI